MKLTTCGAMMAWALLALADVNQAEVLFELSKDTVRTSLSSPDTVYIRNPGTDTLVLDTVVVALDTSHMPKCQITFGTPEWKCLTGLNNRGVDLDTNFLKWDNLCGVLRVPPGDSIFFWGFRLEIEFICIPEDPYCPRPAPDSADVSLFLLVDGYVDTLVVSRRVDTTSSVRGTTHPGRGSRGGASEAVSSAGRRPTPGAYQLTGRALAIGGASEASHGKPRTTGLAVHNALDADLRVDRKGDFR